MNATVIINKYIEEFDRKPVLKTWECPDFYRTSYHYTEKKIAKIAEKENARLLAAYNREIAADKVFTANVEKIHACPDRLAYFFASSMQNFIERTRKHREAVKARIGELEAFFGREVKFTYQSSCNKEPLTSTFRVAECRHDLIWRCTRTEGSGKYKKTVLVNRGGDTYTWTKFDAVCPTEVEKTDFIAKSQELDGLKAELHNNETPADVFYRMVENIGGRNGIVDSMVKVLDGMPDSVELDSNWGAGGYYNGIVSRGEKRASFKSFYAGGWNIQRLHIRFRVTLLKNKAA